MGMSFRQRECQEEQPLEKCSANWLPVQDHVLGSPHTEPHPKNGVPTQIKDDEISLLEIISESDKAWNLRMLEPPRAQVVTSSNYVTNGKTLTPKRKLLAQGHTESLWKESRLKNSKL